MKCTDQNFQCLFFHTFISCTTICTFNWFSISWHLSRSPRKFFYEHPVTPFRFPCFSITIFCTATFTKSGHKLLRTKVHFRTPGHVSGRSEWLETKSKSPTNASTEDCQKHLCVTNSCCGFVPMLSEKNWTLQGLRKVGFAWASYKSNFR